MRFKGPLADSYPGAAALVICALVPYLALSTALVPLTPALTKGVGLSEQALQLTSGMANAAYAFGTVAAVQLALHLPGRRMLILYASLFVVGSVLTASAWTPGLFIAGRVTQGLSTSLMLIAAVPPLVTGWPASKLPFTGATMNLCVFGAVALGPVIGGLRAGAHAWRTLFWIVAAVGTLALLFALLTFEDQPPQDTESRWDLIAQGLAGGGCAAAFFGASELETHAFTSPIALLPLLAGIALLAALLLYEYHLEDPLVPLRLLGSTLPLAGILVAMCAGAASVAIVELSQTALQAKLTPSHLALLFVPEFAGALATAVLFAALIRTRLIPVFAGAGMVLLCAAGAVLSGVASGPDALVATGSGLIGLGVGASVSPAMFLAGFSLSSEQIQRVFALIELLRGAAAFMLAPIILHVAKTALASPARGTRLGVWICVGIAAVGGVAFLSLLLLGRARLSTPRLEPWLEGEGPALDSPALLGALRGGGELPAPGALAGEGR